MLIRLCTSSQAEDRKPTNPESHHNKLRHRSLEQFRLPRFEVNSNNFRGKEDDSTSHRGISKN